MTSPEAQEELILDRYFSAVWRAKWFIIILTLAAAGITAFIVHHQPELHTATAFIEIGKVWKEPLEDPYTTTEIVNSAAFAQEIGRRIGERPANFRRGVRAEVIAGGTRRASYAILIRITGTNETADDAMRLPQAAADALLERHAKLFDDSIAPHLDRQRRLEQRIKELSAPPASASRELLFKLESELDEVRANNLSPTVTQRTRLVGTIVATPEPRPSLWRSTATAALIAAIAGVAMAVLASHFRTLNAGRAASKQGQNDAPNS